MGRGGGTMGEGGMERRETGRGGGTMPSSGRRKAGGFIFQNYADGDTDGWTKNFADGDADYADAPLQENEDDFRRTLVLMDRRTQQQSLPAIMLCSVVHMV